MKILAIDTCTDACSAALLINDEVSERFQVAPRQHATLILAMMQSVLDEAGLTLNQLDALAFSCGPGAFTGVRLATSVVQGAGFGADLPVVPVSSLAALAHGLFSDTGHRRILVALDARMQEVFWGAYEIDAEHFPVLVTSESVVAPTAVPLPAAGAWYGVGSGFDSYQQALQQRLGSALMGMDASRYPHARDVAKLGAYGWQGGLAISAEAAQPTYLRNEVAWKKQPVKKA